MKKHLKNIIKNVKINITKKQNPCVVRSLNRDFRTYKVMDMGA